MTFKWTAQAKLTLADLLVDGKTAAECGRHFGVSRNAITGLLARDADLSKIGFARQGKSRNGGQTKRFTDEEMLERRRQYNRAYKANKRAGAIVIPFPTSTKRLSPNSPQVAGRPRLRIVSNNVPLMVQDWLEKNGGPRKFEDRERSDSMAIQQWLSDRGITIKATRGNWGNNRGNWNMSRGLGRPKNMTWAAIMEVVDGMRLAEGLQPFCARSHLPVERMAALSRRNHGTVE